MDSKKRYYKKRNRINETAEKVVKIKTDIQNIISVYQFFVFL